MALGSYLDDLKKVLGIGGAFAAVPLIAAFSSLEPPWPPAIGYVSAALILVTALLSWEWTRRSRTRNRRRWVISGVAILLVGLLAYFYLYSNFVDDVPGTKSRVIRGYVCTRQAMIVYPNDCPGLPTDALQGAEWEPTELWTRQSVTNVRLGLVGSWLSFMAGLMLVTGGIVAGRKVSASR